MRASPERSTYRPGEVMVIWVVRDKPVGDFRIRVKGMGQEWVSKPLRDTTVPTAVSVAVQVPPCSVVPGYTVTGYPLGCAPGKGGPQRFTVELLSPDGKVLDRASFTVTVLGGTGGATGGTPAQTPVQEEGKSLAPLLLMVGVSLLRG